MTKEATSQNNNSLPIDLTDEVTNSEQNIDEWQQVTPKKTPLGSTGVMQNKFVLLSQPNQEADENSSSYSLNSPSSGSRRSQDSFNRYNALLVGSDPSNIRARSMASVKGDGYQSLSKLKTGAFPDLSQSGSQAALQKQITCKLKEMRKKGLASSPAPNSISIKGNDYASKKGKENYWLSSQSNISRLRSFVDSFEWSTHEAKLDNLWISVLGNPQKCVFILLDYLEELFLEIFPSVMFHSDNFMDDLPTSSLFETDYSNELNDDINDPKSPAYLVDLFRTKVESRLESFLRQKLESPEFNIEDIFGSLIDIVLKCQKFKSGSNSFASILILSKLLKIFPFQ